jgi:hypothetical protein
MKFKEHTVIRESFLNKQMALYVLSLIWRKGYYGAYRTPDILRPFLFFFIFFSSFTYERKREKGNPRQRKPFSKHDLELPRSKFV